MKTTLYVFKDGKLSRNENTLLFRNEELRVPVPLEGLRGVELHGGVSLTSGALRLALEANIPIHIFSTYGHYQGSFWPKEHYFSGDLTIRQALFYSDESKRLRLSSLLLAGVLKAMNAVLKAQGAEPIGEYEALEALLAARTINRQMLLEAGWRREYYARLDTVLPMDWMIMERTRRPPRNHINSLLGFGNGLLYAALLTEARKTPLNPTIPFLHAPSHGRFSLMLDVSEIFKPWIVDHFIFGLVRQGILEPNEKFFHPEGGGIMLNERGRRTFVEHWDKHLETSRRHPRLRRKVTNRSLLRLELHKLTKHFTEIEEYRPYEWKKP